MTDRILRRNRNMMEKKMSRTRTCPRDTLRIGNDIVGQDVDGDHGLLPGWGVVRFDRIWVGLRAFLLGCIALDAGLTLLVITSYSIHYTKLYETAPSSTRNGTSSCSTRTAVDASTPRRPLKVRLYCKAAEVDLGTERRAKPPKSGATTARSRITSYNVCSPKLVRGPNDDVVGRWHRI